jgi:hypothetical protein
MTKDVDLKNCLGNHSDLIVPKSFFTFLPIRHKTNRHSGQRRFNWWNLQNRHNPFALVVCTVTV